MGVIIPTKKVSYFYFVSMIDLLNNNQGVLACLGIMVTIIGFFITNTNIKINKQNQKISGKNSQGIQAGRDVTDSSLNLNK